MEWLVLYLTFIQRKKEIIIMENMELEKFKDLCKEIASKMNYVFVDNITIYHNFFKIQQGDYCIYLSEPYGNTGKLNVSGEYPRNCKNEYYAPDHNIKINVSITKSVDKIVSDIQHRFLPKYLENLTKIQQKVKFANEYYNNKELLLNKLADYTGLSIASHRDYTIDEYTNEMTIEFRVSRDTAFDIELTNISLEKTKAIWNIIKNL